MIDNLTIYQYAIIVFLFLIILIAATNCFVMRRIKRVPLKEKLPTVSVLVPAKDEEKNIEKCVSSLLAQDYPNFELTICEDGSHDETAMILERMSHRSKKLKVISGPPAPMGWIGKHWACHQLAEQATGEILLFTDADTYHMPNSIGDAVSVLVDANLSLLTAIPRQDVRTIGEKIIVLPMLWSVVSFSPLLAAYTLKWPGFAAANGQFMMFMRSAYKAIGGHEAVKENVVDDLALVKRVVAAKLSWRYLDGRGQFSCRMYRSFREAWNGLTKNLFGSLNYSIPFNLFVWTWLAFVFIEPLFVIAFWAAGIEVSTSAAATAGVAAMAGLALWFMIYVRFGIPVFLAFLYPLTIIVYVALGFNSMRANLSGQAEWKGQKFKGKRSPWK